MKRNAIVLSVVTLAVALMLYAGSRLAVPHDKPAAGGKLRGNPQGALAPDFTLQSLDGRTVRLADLRGKAVVLNFWATWCGPCKIEMPWLDEFQKKYSAQGVEVIGVSMDEDRSKVGPFIQELGVGYTILHGTEEVGDAYGGVQFLPATFYIDREGKIVDRVFGLVSHSEIEGNIKKSMGTVAAVPPAQEHADTHEGH
ncbi:MAG TPA: TlpA disulfide reductase family protein [Terriglobales bacterium]|nr:TlpA disulfide reductase family protein [Terriglobales bacterium]